MIELIDCNFFVSEYIKKLFKNTPSFVGKYKYQTRCKTRINQLPSVAINQSTLLNNKFTSIIEENLIPAKEEPYSKKGLIQLQMSHCVIQVYLLNA